MSGHSKWATIRRKKEKIEAARGKVFTKLIRELQIAARDGSDPNANPRLRSAVDAAKAVNMPAANIERAIKKGAGESDGAAYEEVTYEGYGPGGVAVMIECVTDNRNRTVGEVRHCFTKRNGTMAEAGAVAWMFDRLGRLTLDGAQGSEDEIMEIALESGARDVKGDSDGWEILTDPENLYKVKSAVEGHGKRVESAELAYVPKNTIKVEDASQAKSLLGLVEALEELDDTQQVHANFEMDDSLMESIAG
ncbi:YebC/PmpR family DNA-binding transcriptional regulator [bacterium]|nr:YebC/PmpR family DNA-binding transcriptional regulator [bacterium]